MKLLLTTICVASMSFAATTHAQAREHHAWRHQECRYRFQDGRGGWTRNEVEETIGCAVDHWRVRGGIRAARCIADHESGDRPLAYNPSGASGVMQLMRSTFAETWVHHRRLARRWSLRRNIFNARSNVVLGIHMAHAGGWSPWTTAAGCGV